MSVDSTVVRAHQHAAGAPAAAQPGPRHHQHDQPIPCRAAPRSSATISSFVALSTGARCR